MGEEGTHSEDRVDLLVVGHYPGDEGERRERREEVVREPEPHERSERDVAEEAVACAVDVSISTVCSAGKSILHARETDHPWTDVLSSRS